VFSPPLISYARAYDFGAAVREIIEGIPGDLKVAFLATGGLSHWPPVWTEGAPETDSFLQRMRRYQTEGKSVLTNDPELYSDLARYEIEMMTRMQWPLGHQHPLVNEVWDREILEAFERGDVKYIRDLSYDEVEKQGGHGGHELLNWVALMGAMRGAAADYVVYEKVVEWIAGMGYAAY
jgi:2,3-dihydroxyphenylpropionate 1,2-dioxygenase